MSEWSKKIITDKTDFISRKPAIKRLVSIPFDRVIILGDDFVFYRDDALVCSVCRTVFTQIQQDFFEAIADPI